MAPTGYTRRSPFGKVFSISMIKASRAIQYRWAMPAANITSISAQQQPRQKSA